MEKSLGEKFYDAFIKFDRWELYLKGLKTTLIVALIAIIIGIVIGVVVAMVNYVNKKTGKLITVHCSSSSKYCWPGFFRWPR